MILARVSNIEAFRRWRLDEAQSVEDLVRWITTDEPSERMLAGTAFHAALETAGPGNYETLTANDYIFHLPEDMAVELPAIREVRVSRDYGGITVTGKADCVHGRTVIDHKTTARFDAESYLAGCQWKFYLDLFEADTFQWNVFEVTETAPGEYRVKPPQVLRAYRYPDLRDDCTALARDYWHFAKQHLPAPEPEAWEMLYG